MSTLRFTGDATLEEFEQACSQQRFWYHSFYFDNGFAIRGDYDIGRDVDGYGFPPLAGKRVLDIGTGGGWFAHWFAQQGAAVTTVDLRGISDFDWFGRESYPAIETEKTRPDRVVRGAPVYDSPVSGAFWVIHDLLGSDVRFVNSRVYDLEPATFGESEPCFDFVFLGALLLHLRDPIGALRAARRCCRGEVMATTPVTVDDNPHPVMAAPYTHLDPISWWLPNKACFAMWFEAAGFGKPDVDSSVALTADKPVMHPHWNEWRNPSQTMQIGRAPAERAPLTA